jgi:cell fate (sporulation/competence/biofilm development) regulator YmcA (YheA/YmcA/DUF963 family)
MNERNKLIEMIQSDESVKRYLKIEKIVNENPIIKSKMENLKSIQKQMINARELGKHKAFQVFQEKYQILLEEIQNEPIMLEYFPLQSEINQLLDNIFHIIEEGLTTDKDG